jgi:transposase
MSNKKSKYTGEEKEKILKDKRENELTYRQVIEKYKVPWNTVKNWERIYKEDGVLGLYEEHRRVATKETSLRKGRPMEIGKNVNGDLNAQIKRLKMENEYLKKLNALVEKRRNFRQR